MTEERSYSTPARDLVLPPLPKKHAHFDTWEFEVRARVNAAASAEFDCSLLLAQINPEAKHPWVFVANGTGSEKVKFAYRKINSQLWSALLHVMREAIKAENDGSSTLRWKLFYDLMVKATTKMCPAEVFGDEEPRMRPMLPEFNGQFLWCKMKRHVLETSRSSVHAAKEHFNSIRLQGNKVLEFFATVDEVAEEAGFGDIDKFLLIKRRLESHREFSQPFQTWRLGNPGSTDLNVLVDYFTEVEADRYNRFKHVPVETRRWGAGAIEGTYGDYHQGDDSDSAWYWGHDDPGGASGGGYFAAAAHAESDDDEDPGRPHEFGDAFWDSTTNTEASWQVWNMQTPPVHFALAVRFKGRKGKPGKGGFRRMMPKGRKFGKGAGKGAWSPYGAKGKGVAAPTPEEDCDPFSYYSPESTNPLDHFYWDADYGMSVYDPLAATAPAVAAMKGRKKGGKKSGKKGGKGPGTPGDPCISWSQNRCSFGDQCRYSHAGPGGLKGSQNKGAVCQTSPGQPAVPSQALTAAAQQQQVVPSQALTATGQQAVPSHATAAAQRAITQHQLSNIMANVAPEHRGHMQQFLSSLERTRTASAAVPFPSPSGPSSDFWI